MALALGGFTNAFVGADEKRKDRRAQNAQLYANWISANPDASVDERKEYYGNLAGNSRGLQSGIPTEETMKRQVKKYKDKQAKIAAANERAAEDRKLQMARQSLNDINSVAKSLSPLFGDEAAAKEQAVATGLISPEQFEQVYARMKTFAYADWNDTNKLLISDYLKDPTQAALDALEGTTTSAELQTMIKTQYKGALDREVTRQNNQAAVAYQKTANTALTQADFDAQNSAIAAEFPLATVTGATSEQSAFFTERMGNITEQQTAKAKNALNTAASRASSLANYNAMVEGIQAEYPDLNIGAAFMLDATLMLKGRLRSEAERAALAGVKTVENEEQWQALRAEMVRLYGANFPAQAESDDFNFLDAAFAQKELMFEKSLKGKKELLEKELLKIGQEMTPDAYENAKALIEQQAKELGITLDTSGGDDQNSLKAGRDATDAQQEIIQAATTIAGDAKSIEEYERRIEALKSANLDVEVTDELLAGAKALFTKQQAARNEKQTEALQLTVADKVNNADMSQAAKQGKTAEEAIEDFLIGLKAGLQENGIVLTDDQESRLREDYGTAITALTSQIDNAVNPTQTPEEMQATIQGGREKWLKVIQNTLQTDNVKFTPAIEALASGGFDAIFANLRNAKNAEEGLKVATARSQMENNRGFITQEDISELTEAYIKSPIFVGDSTDEKTIGGISIALTTQAITTIRKAVEDLGLPIDKFLVEEIMSDAQNLAAAEGQTIVDGSGVNRALNVDALKGIIFNLVQVDGLAKVLDKNGAIEQAAFNEAAINAGITNFATASETDLKIFRGEYARLREVIRTSVFDTVDPEFTNTADRSSAMVAKLQNRDGEFSLEALPFTKDMDALFVEFSGYAKTYEDPSIPDAQKLIAGQNVMGKADGILTMRQGLSAESARVQREIGNLQQALQSGMYPKQGVDSGMREKIETNLVILNQQRQTIEQASKGLTAFAVATDAKVKALELSEQKRLQQASIDEKDAEDEVHNALLNEFSIYAPNLKKEFNEMQGNNLQGSNALEISPEDTNAYRAFAREKLAIARGQTPIPDAFDEYVSGLPSITLKSEPVPTSATEQAVLNVVSEGGAAPRSIAPVDQSLTNAPSNDVVIAPQDLDEFGRGGGFTDSSTFRFDERKSEAPTPIEAMREWLNNNSARVSGADNSPTQGVREWAAKNKERLMQELNVSLSDLMQMANTGQLNAMYNESLP